MAKTDSTDSLNEEKMFKRDWVSKTLAGIVLGMTLSLTCSGLYLAWVPTLPLMFKAQIAMWIVAPVWLGVLSTCYLFRSGWRAWAWLGGANALLLGGLLLLGSGR